MLTTGARTGGALHAKKVRQAYPDIPDIMDGHG